MRIAIMGAGGLGSYLGGRMVHAGLDVTFIARGEQLRALRQNGLEVKSAYGDYSLGPVKATDKPTESGPVDLILFCVKSYDTLLAAQLIKPMVVPQTAIIPVLNGIDHVKTLGDVVGSEHVLGGVAMIVAHMIAPGKVEQLGPVHQLEFGEMGGDISERCISIEETLAATGIEVKAIPNIVERMWWKLCIVCGFAGVFSVVRGNKAVVSKTPEPLALLRQAIVEAVAVAQANGISLSPEIADEILKSLEDASPEYKPSMLVDLEKGRRLELEAVIGIITRSGKDLGVPTPVNDFIYACLKPYINGRP